MRRASERERPSTTQLNARSGSTHAAKASALSSTPTELAMDADRAGTPAPEKSVAAPPPATTCRFPKASIIWM